MEKVSMHKIKCSVCGKEFEREVRNELDQNDLGFVMGWNVFLQTCPHCNEEFVYKYPVIYRDNEKKFVVGYTPGFEDFQVMLDEFEKENDKKSIYRIVPIGHMRFIEKVGVLSLGINDIVGEVYKEILFLNLKKDNIQDMLFEFNEECTACGIAVLYKDSDEIEYYDIDTDTLDALYKDVEARGVLYRYNDYIVNRKLANKILYNKDDLTPLHIDLLKEIEENNETSK